MIWCFDAKGLGGVEEANEQSIVCAGCRLGRALYDCVQTSGTGAAAAPVPAAQACGWRPAELGRRRQRGQKRMGRTRVCGLRARMGGAPGTVPGCAGYNRYKCAGAVMRMRWSEGALSIQWWCSSGSKKQPGALVHTGGRTVRMPYHMIALRRAGASPGLRRVDLDCGQCAPASNCALSCG